MEDFEKKVSISDDSEDMDAEDTVVNASKIVSLLRQFLAVQQRRAQAYARLKRCCCITGDLMITWCQEVNQLINNFAVLELESLFLSPDFFREDLARLLRSVQTQEKQKLQLTATIQVLKKAGRPSERLVSHENCRFHRAIGHECVHINKITEASGTEEAEADAEFDSALKEAIKAVQDAVITINEHLEEVRYEIAALEAE